MTCANSRSPADAPPPWPVPRRFRIRSTNSRERFEIDLPALEADLDPQDLVKQPEVPRGNGELVLVSEDEAAVRQVARRTLEEFGYRVLLAEDGATSGLGEFALNSRGPHAGVADEFLPKPYSAHHLLQTLREVIDRKTREEEV